MSPCIHCVTVGEATFCGEIRPKTFEMPRELTITVNVDSPDDAALDAEIVDDERAKVLEQEAPSIIADLDEARCAEAQKIETANERQLADLERETTKTSL